MLFFQIDMVGATRERRLPFGVLASTQRTNPFRDSLTYMISYMVIPGEKDHNNKEVALLLTCLAYNLYFVEIFLLVSAGGIGVLLKGEQNEWILM